MNLKILKDCKLYNRELKKGQRLENVHRADAKMLLARGEAKEIKENVISQFVEKVKPKPETADIDYTSKDTVRKKRKSKIETREE